jgi:hypothetical protein
MLIELRGFSVPCLSFFYVVLRQLKTHAFRSPT